MDSRKNHPFVVWASCFLWLISMIALTWSLVLFVCISDMLVITGTDLLNGLVLLLGVIMLPTNIYMQYTISNAEKIDPKAKVLFCPLWLCILWIILLCCVGIGLGVQRIHLCDHTTIRALSHSMAHYRNVPKYKRFVDNLQWSLKCCGLHSYKDWFKLEWCDKLRDYEWDPSFKLKRNVKKLVTISDSVPLSCCKSGSCVSNFLLELGTRSINKSGCCTAMHRILIISMNIHVFIFMAIILTEVFLLRYITSDNDIYTESKRQIHIRHLMPINNNFSSGTSSNPEDTDGLQSAKLNSLKVEKTNDDKNY